MSAAFGALSNALALVVRQEETLIAAVTSIVLPLTFLSSTFMQANLVPGWIQGVSRFNPVNWAAEAGRSAAIGTVDWSLVLERIGLLAGAAPHLDVPRDAGVPRLPAVAVDELLGEGLRLIG